MVETSVVPRPPVEGFSPCAFASSVAGGGELALLTLVRYPSRILVAAEIAAIGAAALPSHGMSFGGGEGAGGGAGWMAL